MELQPALCIVLCALYVGLAQAVRRNKIFFLSLILLIPLVKLTNQKRGICRHRILYSLRLGPSFPNDAKILRSKVSLGSN